MSASCLPGGLSPEPSRPSSSRPCRRSASRSGRSASARSIGCLATGSADRSHARRFSGSTSGRVGTRSSRSRSPARSRATSTRSNRFRSSHPRGLVRVRLTGLPPTTRDALGLASASERRPKCCSSKRRPGRCPRPALAHTSSSARTGRSASPSVAVVALYNDLGPPPERSRSHCSCRRRPVVRARHLALSRDEPDAEIATTLDEAAILAADRGALASLPSSPSKPCA